MATPPTPPLLENRPFTVELEVDALGVTRDTPPVRDKLPANVVLGEDVGVDAKDPFVELEPLLLALANSTTVIATWTKPLASRTSAEEQSMF